MWNQRWEPLPNWVQDQFGAAVGISLVFQEKGILSRGFGGEYGREWDTTSSQTGVVWAWDGACTGAQEAEAAACSWLTPQI